MVARVAIAFRAGYHHVKVNNALEQTYITEESVTENTLLKVLYRNAHHVKTSCSR